MRTALVEILLLFRGIIRWILKAFLVLLVIIIILFAAAQDLKMDWDGKVVMMILVLFDLGILVGYDKLIYKLKPEDMDIYLPF